jgi:hypothetical protein
MRSARKLTGAPFRHELERGRGGLRAVRGFALAPTGSSIMVSVRRSARVADIRIVHSPAAGGRLTLARPLLRIRNGGGPVSISWR